MSEITYLPAVRCEVSEGLTDRDITVCVQDIEGRDQYIHVTPSMVNWEGETPYLPVGIINVDRRNQPRSDRVANRGRFGSQPDVDALQIVPHGIGSARMILIRP